LRQPRVLSSRVFIASITSSGHAAEESGAARVEDCGLHEHACVLAQLRDLILKGEFVPGERLAEIPLAK
jgi:DNA-binding GntR family transcriptional regulator